MIYIILKSTPSSENPLSLKLVQAHIIFVLNFYKINGDGEIRTRDHLVIKALIPCQGTILTQELELLSEVPGYDLYYSQTVSPLIL
jgi:hypothetical protein